MANGESMSLRELLDDPLSEEWVRHSRMGLKLNDQFTFGANAIYTGVPTGSGDGIIRFRIATERFKPKGNF